jgi:hypothetical protein
VNGGVEKFMSLKVQRFRSWEDENEIIKIKER